MDCSVDTAQVCTSYCTNYLFHFLFFHVMRTNTIQTVFSLCKLQSGLTSNMCPHLDMTVALNERKARGIAQSS